MNLGLFGPELAVLATALAVILLDLFTGRKNLLPAVAIIGLAISALLTTSLFGVSESAFYGALAVDGFAVFFKMLFLGIAALVILASTDYAPKFTAFRAEYYALVLIAALGMMLMASAREMISLFVSLELASISLYVLAGFLKDKKSSEASLKYLLLGAMSSAILLYGMTLVFGATGETHLDKIAAAVKLINPSGLLSSPALLLGVLLMLAGFGFKIASFPFQIWVPDVYEGAPTPVVAFLSVGSKAAGFAIILRVFTTAFSAPAWLSGNWAAIFATLAAFTMFIGNLSAIPQTNIKRMMGYSSIAQAGYVMVGLAALGAAPMAAELAQSSILFFLAAYALANIGAFAAIIAISSKTNSDEISSFAGMIRRSPLLTLALSLSLISLIGMPPAAGFMAKVYVFNAGVQNGLLLLIILAVLNSVISAYYYLRVVKTMWLERPVEEGSIPASAALRTALVICSAGILLLGLFPGPVIAIATSAASLLGF